MGSNSKPGWKTYRFDQIATNVNVRVDNPSESGLEHYVGLEHLDSDSLKIRRWGSPSDVEATKLVFKKGDIIFGRRRAYQRKLGMAEFDGICSAHAMVLRAKAEVALPEFLPHFMQSDLFMNRAVEISVGSLSPTINWKALAAERFELPPLCEQDRIVSPLKAINSLLEEHEDLIKAISRLSKARTASLFSGDRVQATSRLEDLIVYGSDGPFGSKLKTEHYSAEGARVIRLNNVDGSEFNDEDQAFIPFEYFKELAGYEVRAGDVIIAGLGDDRIPMGRACIVPSGLGPAVNKADCFCIRTASVLSARYLVHFLNSSEGLQQSRSLAQGTTRKRLNLTNIKRFKIPMRPLHEQEEIADELDLMNTSFSSATNRSRQLHQLGNKLREEALGR